jgi:hypothetical protein
MEKPIKQMREILPDKGIWTIEDFATYLNMNPADVQQNLSNIGVKTFHFGKKYKHRVFKLEDLK